MSQYGFKYQVVDLNESIRRIEERFFMEKIPLVSIIMATYNDKPLYVEKSINSILDQTYKNFELLILDDSTNAETIAAINKYKFDPRVQVLRDAKRLGFVRSLNKGLRIARGEYIARMDGDDIAIKDRLEKQVSFLCGHRSIDILGGQINIIDENDYVTGKRSYPLGGLKLLAFFIIRTPVAHPTVMFRRKIVDDGFDYNEYFLKAEDIDFWIRLYNAGYKFRNLSDTLVNFRVESDFMEKRVTDHAQEDYVLRARRNNFTLKKPFFSLLDLLMSYVRKVTPDEIKSKQYVQENGK